ncbi:arsenate reductase/protein-tyrosine-phosphatase family protein [Modestobacter sp. SYSU DS0657]
MRLLFVCTGNMCRSPLAERLTLAWAHEDLGADSAQVWIASAGTDAQPGRPMETRSARALMELGGTPDGFLARDLEPGMAEATDLVLTMTRRHRNKVLKRSPRAMRWTFALAEAAALLPLADTAGVSRLPLDQRAGALAARLNAARPQRPATAADDIPDPIGQPQAFHSEVGARVAGCLEPLAQLLFAPVLQIPTPRPAVQMGPATVAMPLALPPLPPLRRGTLVNR